MKYISLLIFIGLAGSVTNAETSSRVRLHAVDAFGSALDATLCGFRNRLNGDDLKDLFRNRTAERIPYGDYEFCVHASGFLEHRGIVTVRHPREDFRVALRLIPIGDPITGPQSVLRGSIVNCDKSIWLKIVGIHLDAELDILLSEGRFTLPDMEPGRYVLLAISGERVSPPSVIDVTLNTKPLILDCRVLFQK